LYAQPSRIGHITRSLVVIPPCKHARVTGQVETGRIDIFLLVTKSDTYDANLDAGACTVKHDPSVCGAWLCVAYFCSIAGVTPTAN